MNINDYRPELIAFLTPRLRGNQQLAVDMADSTLATARDNLHIFDPNQGSFEHWVYNIAINRCVEATKGLPSRRAVSKAG